MSALRQYGRADVDYATWYNPWMKLLARTHTRAELEKRSGIATVTGRKAAASRLRALDACGSQDNKSQFRAQMGNVARASGEEKIAISGALEIYELFPEHTKEARDAT